MNYEQPRRMLGAPLPRHKPERAAKPVIAVLLSFNNRLAKECHEIKRMKTYAFGYCKLLYLKH
jgi:hypothetical protein